MMESQSEDKELHTRFASHEAKCEERWKTIFMRLENIEAQMAKLQSLLLTATGTVILFLCGIILTLISGL